MSFKLKRDWGSVACSMKDGVITVEDGLIPDIQVDNCLNGLVFEKQHINFSNNVQCILKSEKYTFVLRWDGSYTVYLAHNNCICANRGKLNSPVYEFDMAAYKQVINGGIIDSPIKEVITACWLLQLNNGRVFLFCDNNAIVGCDVDTNSYYYRYCKTNVNPVKPDLHFGDDRLLYMTSAANTPIVVDKFYNFEGSIFLRPKGDE